MNLKLTPKAQQIIAEKGSQLTVFLNPQVCYSWGGAQSRDIPSVRWGQPEPAFIHDYENLTVDGADIFVQRSIAAVAQNVRIDGVNGGAGTRLFLLGYSGAWRSG